MSRKYNIKFCTYFLALLFITVFAGWCEAVVVDRIVAVVNGEIITKSDIDKAVFAEFGSTPLLKLPKEKRLGFEKARKGALNSLVENKLMLSAAEDMGISVSEEQVNEQILGILHIDAIEKAESILKREGVTLDSFKRRVKNTFLLRRLSSRRGLSEVSVSESEIRDYFSKNPEEFPKDEILNLKYMLFRVPAGASANVWSTKKRKASKVLKEILSGTFNGEGLKHQKYKISELAGLLRGSVGGLSEGSWTPLLKMPYGYALFQVVTREKMGPENNEKINSKIYNKLSFKKAKEKRERFIRELKNKARIEILF